MLRSSFGRAKPKMLSAGKTGRYYFTLHAEYKMREYHLSRQRVIRIIRSPRRTETGIVENTIAVMQPSSVKTTAGKPAWSQEIWVMYKLMKNQESRIKNQERNSIRNSQFRILNSANQEIRIISAWRYPGVSPKRDPIPADILREIVERSEEEV